MYQSVQATGSLSGAAGVLSHFPVIGTALSHIKCIADFANDLKKDDVGYGVAFDVQWWAPFWSCNMNMWSQ